MGTTREQFAVLVKAMKAAYTKPEFLPDKDAFNVWYMLLKDIDHNVLAAAIQSHMQTSPYLPTIADIRASAERFTSKPELTELEAWAMVWKAICNSAYNSEEEFAKLPEIVQKAVGNAANLREWATMDMDTVSSVGQSHFIRNFRTVQNREKENAKLSPALRERLLSGEGRDLLNA